MTGPRHAPLLRRKKKKQRASLCPKKVFDENRKMG
jgi:hypothetical protein